MTVLVFGATGNVGGAALRALERRGVVVRTFPRADGDDLDDPAAVERAIRAADRVVLSTADGPGKVRQETTVIDACARNGVERLVKVSGLLPLPPFEWHARIEEHLRRSAVPSTVLHCSFFTTNLQPRDGVLAAPAGDAVVAMIDPRDVGEAAAAAVLAGGRRAYTLTGPEAITFAQAAERLGASYADVPPEALEHAPMPEWLARHLGGIFALVRANAFAGTTGDLPALLGREASPLRPLAA